MEILSQEKISKFEKLINEIMEQENVRGIAIKAFYKSEK